MTGKAERLSGLVDETVENGVSCFVRGTVATSLLADIFIAFSLACQTFIFENPEEKIANGAAALFFASPILLYLLWRKIDD